MTNTSIYKLFLFLTVITVSQLTFAAQDKVAWRVVRVVGEVMRISPQGQTKAAVAGDNFSEGDVIATGAEGRAKLVMIEGKNEVVLGSRTRLVIERAGSQARGAASGTTLSLTEGQVRSSVNKKYSGEGGDVFEVKTPNAVAGVRGTVFLVSFDRKTARSLLATEEGAVAWSSQGRKILVPKGQFSAVMGQEILPPRAIESNPDVSADVKKMKTEEAPKKESQLNDVPGDSSSKNGATSFDKQGNEVVVVESDSSSSKSRAPASVREQSSVAAPASGGSAGAPRPTIGSEEQKVAMSKTKPGPNRAEPGVPRPKDILKDQKAIREQTNFVRENSGKLNPAVVVVPLQ